MERLINLLECGWIIKFDYDQSAPHKAMNFFWKAKNGFYNLKTKSRFGSSKDCIENCLETLEKIDEDIE